MAGHPSGRNRGTGCSRRDFDIRPGDVEIQHSPGRGHIYVKHLERVGTGGNRGSGGASSLSGGMHTTETAYVHTIQVDELHVVGGKYEADHRPLRDGNGQLTRQYRRLVALPPFTSAVARSGSVWRIKAGVRVRQRHGARAGTANVGVGRAPPRDFVGGGVHVVGTIAAASRVEGLVQNWQPLRSEGRCHIVTASSGTQIARVWVAIRNGEIADAEAGGCVSGAGEQ